MDGAVTPRARQFHQGAGGLSRPLRIQPAAPRKGLHHAKRADLRLRRGSWAWRKSRSSLIFSTASGKGGRWRTTIPGMRPPWNGRRRHPPGTAISSRRRWLIAALTNTACRAAERTTPCKTSRSSIAAWVMGLAQIPFIINFFHSIWKGRKVENDNPWDATTLEWTAPSPPGHGNFIKAPVAYRGPYEYSLPRRGKDYTMQNEPIFDCGVGHGPGANPVHH